jgi:down-regulator of transcription 1
LIATESNDVCGKTAKKTISSEHVLQALQNLGFESYLEELKVLSEDHRQEQKEMSKKSTNKLKSSGLTQEELLKQQAELFQQAREKYEQKLLADQQQNTE